MYYIEMYIQFLEFVTSRGKRYGGRNEESKMKHKSNHDIRISRFKTQSLL